jgi:hypothetical protein
MATGSKSMRTSLRNIDKNKAELYCSKVKMPEEKNFCQELAVWQREHGYVHGKAVTVYPDDMDIFNKMLCCEPPKMGLVKEGRERFIDVDKYAVEVAQRLREMGAVLSKEKNSPIGKLFQKIKHK